MNKAENLLKELFTNELVREYIKDKEVRTEEQALELFREAAAAAGMHVTAEELKEAFLYRNQKVKKHTEAASDEIKKLDPEDLDHAAGGVLWQYDDSRLDGHELFCAWTFHDAEWSLFNDDWCTSNHYFSALDYCPD